MTGRIGVLLMLALGGCGEILGEKEAEAPPIDAETREKVVANVLEGLTAAFDETGPQFYARLPELKDGAAKTHGFADWAEFKTRLHASDPALDVEVANRITARMRELVTRPRD